MRNSAIGLLSIVLLLCTTPASASPGDTTVERGDLQLRLSSSGRVESVQRQRLDWKPEAFSGEVTIGELVRGPGSIRAGELIMRLVAEDLERELAEARRTLAAAISRNDLSQRERELELADQALRLDHSTVGNELAARTLQRWNDSESNRALEMNQLSTQASTDRLVDEREELSQLEKLYSGATLDSQTKDIVLDRARRSLKRSERYNAYALADHDYYIALLHSDRERDVRDAARTAALNLAHLKIRQEIGAIRHQLAAADTAHSLEESTRRVAKLETDRAALEVKAPFNGVLGVSARQSGESVQRGTNLAEVADPTRLRVRCSLPAESLRVAKEGSEVEVNFTALPDCSTIGRISQLAVIGSPEGDATTFPAVIDLPLGGHLPPVGMDTRIVVRGTLRDVLLVPSKSITTGPDGAKVVRRKHGDSIEVVTVRTGATDGVRTEIVEGLTPGDTIEVSDG